MLCISSRSHACWLALKRQVGLVHGYAALGDRDKGQGVLMG